MKRHRLILRLYKAGIRLYPKQFRNDYGKQMLTTTRDMLLDNQTGIRTMLTVIRLGLDLFLTIIEENAKQLGDIVKKHVKRIGQEPKRKVVLSGSQVLGVALLSFVWLFYALFIFNAMRHPGESLMGSYFWSWSAELTADIAPIMTVPLALVALHKVAKLTLWQKIAWSYSFGVVGTAFYLLIAYIANSLSIRYTGQHHHYEWALGLVFLVVFYLILLNLGANLGRRFGKEHGAR